MATRDIANTELISNEEYCRKIRWTGLTKTTDDVGSPLQAPAYVSKSVQITGTFGAGGNLKIEGSNNGVDYVVLTDMQGVALDLTAARVVQINENTKYIRPRVTAGDVTTDLAVTLLIKKKTR